MLIFRPLFDPSSSTWSYLLGDQVDGFLAVAGLGDDLQRRPDLGQPSAQLLAHQAFIVGQHGARRQGLGLAVHAVDAMPAA